MALRRRVAEAVVSLVVVEEEEGRCRRMRHLGRRLVARAAGARMCPE